MRNSRETQLSTKRRREFEALLEWAARESKPITSSCRPLSEADLISLSYYNSILSAQCSCMILSRTFPIMLRLGLRTERIGLEDILRWRRDLSVECLYEAYCTYPNPTLIGLMAILKIDEAVIDFELITRLQDKPVTQEFIRLDWLGEYRTAHVKRLLKIERRVADLQQWALLKALEVWRKPGTAHAESFPLPPFPAEEMLPPEREFWEGPMRRAWELGHAAALKQTLPVFIGEKESIPNTVDNMRREERRKRREWIEFLRDADTLPGERAEPSKEEPKPQPARAIRAVHAEPQHGADILAFSRYEAESLYQMAVKRWGERGGRFVQALANHEDITEACTFAGISRTIGYKYLRTLRKTRSQKNLP